MSGRVGGFLQPGQRADADGAVALLRDAGNRQGVDVGEFRRPAHRFLQKLQHVGAAGDEFGAAAAPGRRPMARSGVST